MYQNRHLVWKSSSTNFRSSTSARRRMFFPHTLFFVVLRLFVPERLHVLPTSRKTVNYYEAPFSVTFGNSMSRSKHYIFKFVCKYVLNLKNVIILSVTIYTQKHIKSHHLFYLYIPIISFSRLNLFNLP